MAHEPGDPGSLAIRTLEGLSRTTGSLSTARIRDLNQAAEIGKQVLEESAAKVVKSFSGAPLLTSKSADGTPCKTMEKHKYTTPSGKVFWRVGRAGHEFLLKNQFIRGSRPAGVASQVVLQDPVPLLHGKTAGAIFAACSQHWRSLRQLGHHGIAIEHYCYDRCGLEAQERMWRVWHERAHIPQEVLRAKDCPSEHRLRMSELVLVTACAAHDVQSAYRWAMGEAARDRTLLRDVYISIEALRNSMDIIVGHIAEWVAKRMEFVRPIPEPEAKSREYLWLFLGVEEETAHILAHKLQLHFHDNRIQVSEGAVGDPDLIDTIITCMQSAFKFIKFSESRFLTVGVACRTLLAAFLLGIEDLVAFIKADEHASKWYLNGFARLRAEPGRMEFVAKAAFVSRVTDGVMAEILKDPRAALRYDEYWKALCEDMKYIVELPESVWETAASIIELEPDEFRSSCIQGGHVSFHFFWRRVLQPAGELPWSLCQGDLAQNLKALGERDVPPPDPVSSKLWQMVRSDFSEASLVRTLELMRDISWSTLPVEQQHGSMASLHRHHPEYTTETLVARTLVHHLYKLLPKVTKEQKQVDTMQRQIQALMNKHPSRASGRQLLLGRLFAKMRSQAWTHSTREVPADMRHRIMKGHARIWRACPLADQHQLDTLAMMHAQGANSAIAAKADCLRRQRDELLAEIAEEADERRPLVMSECSLSEEQLARFGELLGSKEFGATKVQLLRANASSCPRPIADPVAEPRKADYCWSSTKPQMPEWAQQVCQKREHFEGVVFMVRRRESKEYEFWKFVYAVKSPAYLAISRVRRDESHPAFSIYHDPAAPPRDLWAFHCNFADNDSAAVLREVAEASIFVIPDVRHLAGMRMAGPCEALPFRHWMALVPDPEKAGEPAAKKARKQQIDPALMDAFPFAFPIEERTGSSKALEKSKAKPSKADDSEGEDSDESTEEEVGDSSMQDAAGEVLEELEDWAMKTLDDARAALAEKQDLEVDSFKTVVLGGKWTEKHKKMVFDSVQGKASGNLANTFCDQRGLQYSMRFGGKTRDFSVCGVLARAWCHRMQHFFNSYIASPLPKGTEYPEHIHSDYVETSEFQALVASATDAWTLANIEKVRAVRI